MNPLNKDIDINSKNKEGETSLILATKYNSLEVMNLSLDIK